MDATKLWCTFTSILILVITFLVCSIVFFAYINSGFFEEILQNENIQEHSICGDSLFGGICDRYHVCTENIVDNQPIGHCSCPVGFHGEKCDKVCRKNKPSKSELGFRNDEFKGWYDVSGCGECFDYCRWAGDGEVGDPSQTVFFKNDTFQATWICNLAGGTEPKPFLDDSDFWFNLTGRNQFLFNKC